jgi:LacI family transcriptional regulator
LNRAGGNTRVGEATRKKILRVAERLGYVRNESAQRLRTGKSNTVGFIGGDLRNPFFSELASALEREQARFVHERRADG